MARADSLSVAELEQMLEARRSELSELESRRNKLAAELEQCDARISELTGARGRGRGRKVKRRRPGRPGGGGGGRKQPALKSVIVEVLQKSKKPLSVDEIVDRVLATGYRSKSDEFRKVAYLNLFHLKTSGEVNHDPATKLYSANA
jgi:hypothetical protein